jgi:hypothetical protein
MVHPQQTQFGSKRKEGSIINHLAKLFANKNTLDIRSAYIVAINLESKLKALRKSTSSKSS